MWQTSLLKFFDFVKRPTVQPCLSKLASPPYYFTVKESNLFVVVHYFKGQNSLPVSVGYLAEATEPKSFV